MSFSLLLILFKIFTSTLYESFNSEARIMDKILFSKINLKENQNETFELFKGPEKASVYFSVLILGEAQIKVYSTQNEILNGTNEFKDILKLSYNASDYNDKDIKIYLNSNKEVEIEVTNIIQNKYVQYQNIFLKDNDVNKTNFILFLNNTEYKYQISVNFNNSIEPKSCYYKLLKLPTNNLNYILPAFNYENPINQCKLNNHEFRGKDANDSKNKNYTAFIFSIKDESDFNYTVNVTKVDEAMIIFRKNPTIETALKILEGDSKHGTCKCNRSK